MITGVASFLGSVAAVLALFMGGGGDPGGGGRATGALVGSSQAPEAQVTDYRREIGHVCAEMLAVRDRELRRESAFRKRVLAADTVDAQRGVILDEVDKRLNSASHLLSRLEAQEPPTVSLATIQRETVTAAERNIRRLQSYRDGLRDVKTHQQLEEVVDRMNRRRSVTETDTREVRSGVQRLGGPDCRFPLTRPPARIEVAGADVNPPPAKQPQAPPPQVASPQSGVDSPGDVNPPPPVAPPAPR